MDIAAALTDQRDSLREMTRHADTKASLLLLAPGAALAGAGVAAGLTGAAHTLAAWALIVAVAMAAPIGAAIAPRRGEARRQGRSQIIAAAERQAAGGPDAVDQLGAEVERLQAIIEAKWGWVRLALLLGALALALAAAAVITGSN